MTGTLHIVGTGPGDPELMTVRAVRVVQGSPVVAFFAKVGRTGHARRTAKGCIGAGAELLRFEYPYTTEIAVDDAAYGPALRAFYDASAEAVATRLGGGRDVALLCEGDPFFYGSAMYLFDRLVARFPVVVVPGVTAMSGCWSAARMPMAHGDDVLSVLPGTLPTEELARRLGGSEAAVVMKVGSNLGRVREAVERSGRTGATLVERGTMAGERVVALAEAGGAAPYFSLVLVPGRRGVR